MEREIKFRGRTEEGEWLTGDFFQRLGYYPAIIETYCTDEGKVGYRETAVEENTVGQYTGLKDKNGVEIYEGDVVKSQFSKNPLGIVTWHTDAYFYIDFSFGRWEGFRNGFTPLGEMMKIKIDGENPHFEVIGNIHDTTELLNE